MLRERLWYRYLNVQNIGFESRGKNEKRRPRCIRYNIIYGKRLFFICFFFFVDCGGQWGVSICRRTYFILSAYRDIIIIHTMAKIITRRGCEIGGRTARFARILLVHSRVFRHYRRFYCFKSTY